MIVWNEWRHSTVYRYCNLCDDLIAPKDKYRYLYGGVARGHAYSAYVCQQCAKDGFSDMPIIEAEVGIH